MKQQIERLHLVLQHLHDSSRADPRLPHVVVRGWLTQGEARQGYSPTVLVVEEEEKLSGDTTQVYEIEDIEPYKFHFMLRIKKHVLEKFKSLFHIRRLRINGLDFWHHTGSHLQLVMDLWDNEKKIKSWKPTGLTETASDNLEKDEKLKRIEHYLERPAPRTKECMDRIYEIFREAEFDDVSALRFDPLLWEYSKPLVLKAKKQLGIMSKRAGGKWYWTTPEYAPSAASELAHRRRIDELKARLNTQPQRINPDRPSLKQLKEVMVRGQYAVPANIVMDSLMQYQRGTVLKAKRDLGIMSIRQGRINTWVWIGPDVREKLLEVLKDGPVPLVQVHKLCEWHPLVIRVAHIKMKQLKNTIINGRLNLYDDDTGEYAAPVKEAPMKVRKRGDTFNITWLDQDETHKEESQE